MRMKASAYKQYGDAAVLALVLEALPLIAKEVEEKEELLIFFKRYCSQILFVYNIVVLLLRFLGFKAAGSDRRNRPAR
jgi:hypothetical protein